MKRFVLAALGALLISLPAFAQTTYSSYDSSGGLTNLLVTANDALQLKIWGGQWATAQFTVVSAGTATATAQVSIDGKNWFASAYAKRLSTISANPTVQAISATTLITGDVWEVPLPANALQFRLLCAGSGTATTVAVYGGTTYTPGVPVVATLYDVTSAVNTLNDTGTMEVGGWNGLLWFMLTPAGGGGNISYRDDGGGTLYSSVTVGAAATAAGGWGTGMSMGGANATPGVFALASQEMLPRRIQITSNAVVALTSRVRVEVRR